MYKGVDKDCRLVYVKSMEKTVSIRLRKVTRDRLHSIKNPGQTLDGIITQLIDSWKKVKEEEAARLEKRS